MKNRILALFLLLTMMFSVSGQMFAFAYDDVNTAPTQNGAETNDVEDVATIEVGSTSPSTLVGSSDSDWIAYAGSPAITFAENGYSKVTNLSAWGARAYYAHKVKLDGLEISFRSTSNSGDCVGIIFGNSAGNYLGDAGTFAVTYWNALYGQARLNIGTNHDYNAASFVYSSPDTSAAKGFGVASSMVANQADTMGFALKFASYNDEFYSLKITMTDGAMWEANANYNSDDKSCTVYILKSDVAELLDENGECYIISAGFPSGENPACSAEYKISDANYRAYLASDDVKNAQEKVNAYKSAAEAITDADSYDIAMTAREAALSEVSGDKLRARELAELNLIISGADEGLSTNDNIVTIVKKAVTDKIDAAKAAYDELAQYPKTTLTSDSLDAALELTKAAKAEYEKRSSMLSSEVKAEIDTAISALEYQHKYSVALLWITDYMRKIEALDATDPSIVNDLVTVKAYREGYEASNAYTNITTALTAADKASLETAIAECDAAVVNIETVVLPELKESYIEAMEKKLEADLTIKPNLDDAKSAYADIATYVTITEADGELYTRYTAGYDKLKNACEAYVRAQIKSVSDLLKVKYTVLDDFKSVRNSFKAIDLDYLMEENAEIAAELSELDKSISANIFYYMNSTSIPLVEWNNTGLAVESKVEFPARLNYNKALDLTSGVEVVIELTSAAYYNDGTSANNLCFNFLGSPDSYKSMSDGISVIIWLYASESNVQIMNYTDNALASATISTPLDGGTITISIKYEEYYSFVEDATYMAYVIKVNEAEIVLTKDALTNNGHTLPDEVYFSMGSFADDKTTPNILTLVSVNDVDFGMPEDNDDKECTDHVDADGDGKCDNCGEEVKSNEPDNGPNDPNEPADDNDDELSFVQKLARFFRGIVDAIKNFFIGLIGKISG